MKIYPGALATILMLGCFMAIPAVAQDDRHEHDQATTQNRDERAYYNNSYYQRGWDNGLHHKKADYHWKNDEDRQAYEAGYAHGERGEKWQSPQASHHDQNGDDHHDDHQ